MGVRISPLSLESEMLHHTYHYAKDANASTIRVREEYVPENALPVSTEDCPL